MIVIADLTPEQLGERLQRARERQAKAQRFDELVRDGRTAVPAAGPGEVAAGDTSRCRLGMIKGTEQRTRAIRDALHATRGHVTQAANLLGVHRTVLWYHMRRLGVGGAAARIREARRRRFPFLTPPVEGDLRERDGAAA